MVVPAGRCARRPHRPNRRRTARHAATESARALPGDGHDRVWLRGRAGSRGMAGADRRLERPVRHSRPSVLGHDIGERGIAYLTLALVVQATAAFAWLSRSVWGNAMRA